MDNDLNNKAPIIQSMKDILDSKGDTNIAVEPSPGGLLAALYRQMLKTLDISNASFSDMIDDYAKNQNNSIRGNLINALSKTNLTIKTFITGLNMLNFKYIRIMVIGITQADIPAVSTVSFNSKGTISNYESIETSKSSNSNKMLGKFSKLLSLSENKHNTSTIDVEILKTTDGYNHINTTLYSNTKLGLMLSYEYPIQFTHPHFGKFSSLYSYYSWLLYNEDIFKEMSHVDINNHIVKSNLTKRKVDNIRTLLYEGLVLKVLSSDELLTKITTTQLPFDHYSLDENLNIKRDLDIDYVSLLQDLSEYSDYYRAGIAPDMCFSKRVE